MKRTSLVALASLCIAAVLFYSSCKKDDSNGNNNNSNCDINCYYGTWKVTSQNCTSGYNVTIVEIPGDTVEVDIGNFDDFSPSNYLLAKVNGLTLSFTNKSNGSKSFTGSGTLSNDGKTITISYTSTSGTCDETWAKQ